MGTIDSFYIKIVIPILLFNVLLISKKQQVHHYEPRTTHLP